MDLFLLTREEYTALDRDILMESISYEHYDDILSRLYNPNFDRIIITKRYIDTIGKDKVYYAFKALTYMTYAFSTKVYLLSHRVDVIDQSLLKFERLGVKPIDLDVKNMTYKEFMDLDSLCRVDVSKCLDEILPSDITEIIEAFKGLDQTDLKEYITLHYDRIASTILRCERLISDFQELQSANAVLHAEVTQLELALNSVKDRLVSERYEKDNLEKYLLDARAFIIRYAESIEQYNKAILGTQINDEFVHRDNKRDTVVLYFKEMEDIGFFKVYDEICNNLRDTYGLRVKSLVLENRNRRYYNPYNNYRLLGLTPTVGEVIGFDKLVKYGNAAKLLEVITRPQVGLEVLMVLDRSYNPNICLQMKNQITYFLGNKRENYQLDQPIPDENFISPYEGSYKALAPLYRDTDKITDISFKLYCNRNNFVIQLVELCRDMLKKKEGEVIG